MADQHRIIIQIPEAYYRELYHIATEVHGMHPTELAEKVVMTFCDNMRLKLYPRLEDAHKEICHPTNTEKVIEEKISDVPNF